MNFPSFWPYAWRITSNDGKTIYVVDYGELYIDYSMPSPFFTTPKSGVIWKVTYTGQ